MTELRPVHTAESVHWYDPRRVRPVYEVPNAKGDKTISPDLRHARKLGLVPGVTGVMRAMAAPALERWKLEQAVMAALTLPREEGESDQTFLTRILEDGREQAAQAADEGTKIHAAIQSWHERGYLDPEHEPYEAHVQGSQQTLDACFGEQLWEPEVCVVHPLGYGTKADLSSVNWVVDFKGKEFAEDQAQDLRLYDNHLMQLAATRAALQHSRGRAYGQARCAIVYVSRSEPGLCWPIATTEQELERGWELFKTCHRLWCLQKRYEPADAFHGAE